MSQLNLSALDRARLRERGISEGEVRRQLAMLLNPPPPADLDRPCVVGDGILALSPDEQEKAVLRALDVVGSGRVTKFVPASGAATRMFQALIVAASAGERPASAPSVREFFARLDDFPFSIELRRRTGVSGLPATEAEERSLLSTLLETMGFADLPKGLIPFHRDSRVRTACEEQLDEGVGYTRDKSGVSRMHFTIVTGARSAFSSVVDEVGPAIESGHQCRLAVSFSDQHPSSDTIAIDSQGGLFRTTSGDLLFRPSGHGALIDNLQELGGDVVVIKNIDNILPARSRAEVVRWKLVLIGVLAQLTDENPSDAPLRVCGMVRNGGEPGGAPFWVRDATGAVTPQIVETAQVELSDEVQRRIFSSSTHFNPVDVVCSVRDASGRAFTLNDFVDPATAFVSRKTYEGRELVALERPGLWNGAMAGWRTVFVEVPASTFAPVKTVFDLLRPEHQ